VSALSIEVSGPPFAPQTFSSWTARSRRGIEAFFRSKGIGAEEARDLAQETFVLAWELQDRYKGAPAFCPFERWLTYIARNVTLNYLNGKWAKHYGGPLEGGDERPDPLQGQELPTVEEIEEAIQAAALTERQAQCLRMWVEGIPQATISELLGVVQVTVWRHIRFAARKIRARLEEEDYRSHWTMFADVSEHAVYYAPTGVWDRDGNSEQVQRRRTAFLRAAPMGGAGHGRRVTLPCGLCGRMITRKAKDAKTTTGNLWCNPASYWTWKFGRPFPGACRPPAA
jgi:RNA polymerase sigma factor (sigma-70 family)